MVANAAEIALSRLVSIPASVVNTAPSERVRPASLSRQWRAACGRATGA